MTLIIMFLHFLLKFLKLGCENKNVNQFLAISAGMSEQQIPLWCFHDSIGFESKLGLQLPWERMEQNTGNSI